VFVPPIGHNASQKQKTPYADRAKELKMIGIGGFLFSGLGV
jgi:hypothetical protein